MRVETPTGVFGAYFSEPVMNRWRLMIVAASAVAALAVGLGAHANPQPDDLQAFFAAINF